MEANRVIIDARIAEKAPLRYTPAGLPVAELVLAHESEQDEAGTRRKVECTLSAVAIGEIARQVLALEVGDELRIKGFLARKSAKSLQTLLHIQEFRIQSN